jgi:prepilin-type N-terminal cleavage/methylation domain-containing protein
MRRQDGFSLAELLMAMLILTIVITTSMAAFLERNRRQQQAREIIAAYQALANEAEYWRRLPFNDLDKPEEQHFRSDLAILNSLGTYNTVVAVARPEPTIRKVTLTVRWAEGKRQARLGVVRVDTGGTNLW